jgi:hypothetical protein
MCGIAGIVAVIRLVTVPVGATRREECAVSFSAAAERGDYSNGLTGQSVRLACGT